MIYEYTKQVATDRLSDEIKKSSITIALDFITTTGTAVKIYFKANLSTQEWQTLDAIVAAHVPTPLPDNEVKTVNVEQFKLSATSGIPKIAAYEPEGESATIVSHNYADPCSWYQGSVKVTNNQLTNIAGSTFKSDNLNWIDLEHGRLYDEDNIMIQTANQYRPLVYVDGAIQLTSTYDIDYPNGQVTFKQPVTGIVTATYYRADKSWFIVKPKPGKILAIKAAEVQFCKDTVLQGPFMFEAWVNHPLYGLIPVPGSQIVYKNFKDFISACNEGQGLIPQIGDLAGDVHVFPFNYARPKPIKSSQGVEIRVYCQTHKPCGGTYATSTFYVTVENE